MGVFLAHHTLFPAALSVAVEPASLSKKASGHNSSSSSFDSRSTWLGLDESAELEGDDDSSDGRVSPRRFSAASAGSSISFGSARSDVGVLPSHTEHVHERRLVLAKKKSQDPSTLYHFQMEAAGLKMPFDASVDVASFSTIKKLYAHLSELCAEWLHNPASHFFPKKFSRWQSDVRGAIANPLSIAVFYVVNNKQFTRLDSFKTIKDFTAFLQSISSDSRVQLFVNYAWGNFGIPLRLRLEGDPATEIKVTLQEECFNSHAYLLNEIARLSKIWGWRKSGDVVHVINHSVYEDNGKPITTNILKYSQKELHEKASVLWENAESYWNVIIEPHLLED